MASETKRAAMFSEAFRNVMVLKHVMVLEIYTEVVDGGMHWGSHGHVSKFGFSSSARSSIALVKRFEHAAFYTQEMEVELGENIHRVDLGGRCVGCGFQKNSLLLYFVCVRI